MLISPHHSQSLIQAPAPYKLPQLDANGLPLPGGDWQSGRSLPLSNLERPILRDTQERARAEREHHALKTADIRARILVVEDESIVALDLIGTLKRMGHTVVGHALRGEDSIKMAAGLVPQLVMMDIHLLGKMDGVEAACWIYANLGTPVIFLSAFGDEATRERAKPAEPAGWLRKPYSKYELEDAIQLALHRTRNSGDQH